MIENRDNMPATASNGLPAPGQLSGWRFIFAVAVISVGTSLTVLDGSITNLALPIIGRDMHAGMAASIWIVNAYQIAVLVALLPLASLGEIIGYRKVFLAGLVLFVAASLLCAAARSLPVLAIGRALQGFGAAGVMGVGSALVRAVYPTRRLGRGIGINSMVVAGSLTAGPAIAGGILSIASWPWLFVINLPFGLLAFAFGLAILPRDAGAPRRFDTAGAMLNVLTFGLFAAGFTCLSHGAAAVLGAGAVGLAAICAIPLYRRQAARESPILPIDLLRVPAFALSASASVTAFIAQSAAFVALPFLMHDRLDLAPAMAGLMLMPWPLSGAAVAPIAGALADHLPGEMLGAVGLLAAAFGLAALAMLPAAASPIDINWRVALCGAGFALFQPPNTRAMIAASPKRRSGGTSGMISTARVLGQTLGAALTALIFKLSAGDEIRVLQVAACVALVPASLGLVRFAVPGFRLADASFLISEE
jgi:DHA2 family multidrug resistance protein-like MFS transporter